MIRRRLISSVAAIGTLAIAGCSGTSNEIVIEYSMTVNSHEDVPEEVIQHPNPEGFSWVEVQFEIATGSFDAIDILGLTQVRAGGTTHFTRAVRIISPDNKLLTSSSDSYTIEADTQGVAYYRTSEVPENPEWVVEQLKNQYSPLEIRKR